MASPSSAPWRLGPAAANGFRSTCSGELLGVLEQHRGPEGGELAATLRLDQLAVELLVALDQVEDLLVDPRELAPERPPIVAHGIDSLSDHAQDPLAWKPLRQTAPQRRLEPL